MLIEFHAHGQTLSPSLSQYMELCIGNAFRRFRRRIRRVRVYLWDTNGPRGGADKGVRLVVELLPAGEVLVRETAANSFVAVGRAVARARYAVRNELGRRRTRRRRVGLRRQFAGNRSAETVPPVSVG